MDRAVAEASQLGGARLGLAHHEGDCFVGAFAVASGPFPVALALCLWYWPASERGAVWMPTLLLHTLHIVLVRGANVTRSMGGHRVGAFGRSLRWGTCACVEGFR